MGEPLNYTTDCCGAVAEDARGAWHRCSSCGCTFLPSDDEMRRNRIDGRDLAPCPFCGGEARWVPPADDAFPSQGYVQCYACDARSPGAWRADTARDLWNRRKGC